MSTEDIKRTELTPSEREVLTHDRERWEKMGAGGHLDDWLAYGPGMLIRRRLAMRCAFTNRPEGKGYAQAFGQLMRDDGIDTSDKSAMAAFTAVVWLYDEPERLMILREIREAMTPGERSRLNSPISARQRIEKVLKARHGGTEESVRTSPVALMKRQIAEQNYRIAHLQEQLAAAEQRDGGSLFDLRLDTAEDIGRTIVEHVSEGRAKTIIKAMTEALQKRHELRKARAPAG